MKKLYKLFIVMIVFWGFMLWSEVEAYASEEIYFDDEGNLIYITYDKKATSSVSYKAIGWILKRYDAPIDAKGQQYVIVRKIEYAVDDPDNPGYLYCYFWSDKDEILDAVGSKSKEWRRQLEEYGDTVYIDNVMTVCNNRVPLGNVDVKGNCTGEVYYTYEGIAGARPWAKPEYLKSYFDISLEFPVLIVEPDIAVTESVEEKLVLKSGNMSFLRTASNEINKEEYDVNSGMPSGEKLYFSGNCDAYYYELDYSKWSHTVYIPVKVSTKYIIKWVDTKGKNKSETLTVNRWYSVPKTITYNVVNTFDIYDLNMVTVSSGLLNGKENIVKDYDGAKATVQKTIYGNYIKHLKSASYATNTADVTLISSNYIKPAIPDTNNYSVAVKAVSDFSVKSDYLSVDGKVILSDKYGNCTGANVKKQSPKMAEVYKGGVLTKVKAVNGVYDDFEMKCTYLERENGVNYEAVNRNINEVVVHTPVVLKGMVYGDKSVNQAAAPSFSDIVLDSDFCIQFDFYGKHNSIKGYGLRDYSEYVGKKYVKFPFEVNYNGENIEAGKWIEVKAANAEFHLPAYLDTGTYNVEYRIFAHNGEVGETLPESANLQINEYGACYTSRVDVVGRIYDVMVSNEDIYKVGAYSYNKIFIEDECKILPLEYDIIEGGTAEISFNAMGSCDNKAHVDVNIKYYHLDRDNIIKEITLMGKEELKENIELDAMEAVCIKDNVYQWKFNYSFPANCSAISKETGEVLSGGMIFIAMDFKFESLRSKTISYLNEANFSKGYCNMWRRQGAKDYIAIDGENVPIMDGTLLFAGIGETTVHDYEVNGTH